MANTTIRCFYEHTKGCVTALPMVPVGTSLYMYLEALRPYCFIPPMTWIKGKFADEGHVRALSTFQYTMNTQLNIGSDFTHDFCYALSMGSMMKNMTADMDEERKKYPFSTFEIDAITDWVGSLWKMHCGEAEPKDIIMKNMSSPAPTETGKRPTRSPPPLFNNTRGH